MQIFLLNETGRNQYPQPLSKTVEVFNFCVKRFSKSIRASGFIIVYNENCDIEGFTLLIRKKVHSNSLNPPKADPTFSYSQESRLPRRANEHI